MIEKEFRCSTVVQAFLDDATSNVKMLMGPVGSGKSSACCIHMYMTAMNMPRGKDGKKRCKWGVVRNTYSQLKTTTIRTWCTWFPEEIFGKVRGDSPLTHVIKNHEVEIEVIFLAVESLTDVQRLKSLELTAIYINEAQFFESRELMQTFIERTNRFPDKHITGGSLGKPLVIMDCNPPSNRHWIYQIFEKERPNGFAIYKMPPALIQNDDGTYRNNPDADYLWQVAEEGHEPSYWLDLAKGATQEYVNVSLMGKYGVLEEGRAIHPEYNDSLHYASRIIDANSDLEIGLGWDFGNTPACAVVQLMPNSQFVILAEFWTEYMSLREFAQNIVVPELDRMYPFWRKNYLSYHDPAGGAMNPDGSTCLSILSECGINSQPAISNSPVFRRDALKYFLTRMPGGSPGFVLSSRCDMLREGLMGKFKYELIKSSAFSESKQYQEKPMKNMHSHICEALEYIATAYASVSKQPPRQTQTIQLQKWGSS
ncbi:hypothetical protein UFOVP1361_55 [uncultured Caudovirales phage]|uniref:Terminase-like family n=1 Tax=uncultured Caudovirales phage TaxID=2100421 RepID=A0A6J5RUM3_9CAUD|nr:hypothetical protein UFOVP1361_55 [uncultured Caudovirales phage]